MLIEDSRRTAVLQMREQPDQMEWEDSWGCIKGKVRSPDESVYGE